IVLGDPERPRNVYYFSEMAMFSVAVLLPLLLFQRDIGGGMEVLATYPVSLGQLVIRKWLLSLLLTVGLGIILMSVYAWFVGGIWAILRPLSGAGAIPWVVMGFCLRAFLNMPGYVLLISLTIVGTLLFRRIYGGLVLCFAVWAMYSLTFGDWLGRWTLY